MSAVAKAIVSRSQLNTGGENGLEMGEGGSPTSFKNMAEVVMGKTKSLGRVEATPLSGPLAKKAEAIRKAPGEEAVKGLEALAAQYKPRLALMQFAESSSSQNRQSRGESSTQPLSTIKRTTYETTGGAIQTETQVVTISQEAYLLLEASRNNHTLVQEGFLTPDAQGRCTPGGVCQDAFQELVINCGDPQNWTEKDMQREDIRELLSTTRVFDRLVDFPQGALSLEEQKVLSRLAHRQQKIDNFKMQQDGQKPQDSQSESQTRAIRENQNRVAAIESALTDGIISIDVHTLGEWYRDSRINEKYGQSYNENDPTTLTWAQPGTDMSIEFTGSSIQYNIEYLKRTDKERQSSLKLTPEPTNRPRTPEEDALLLQQILRELQRKQELKANKKKIEEREKIVK